MWQLRGLIVPLRARYGLTGRYPLGYRSLIAFSSVGPLYAQWIPPDGRLAWKAPPISYVADFPFLLFLSRHSLMVRGAPNWSDTVIRIA